MRQVGHGRIEVVILRLGFKVEVARNSVYVQVAGDLASGMVRSVVRVQLAVSGPFLRVCLLFVPVLEFFVHLQLALGKSSQSCHSPVHLIVRRNGLAL